MDISNSLEPQRERRGGQREWLAGDLSEQKPSTVLRYAVRFEIAGDLRFLSHHDTLRLFERAAVRGSLPLQYSAGFNPNPKLSMPLPRPVGLAGLEEWLLLQLSEPLDPAEVCARLGASLPHGIVLRGCWRSQGRESWQAQEALVEVPLDDVPTGDLAGRIEQVLQAPSAVLHRNMGPNKPGKMLDVRTFIASLALEGNRLQMRLRYLSGATVRPSEVLELLDVPVQPYSSLATRVSIVWGPRDLSDGHLCTSHSRLPEESRNK